VGLWVLAAWLLVVATGSNGLLCCVFVCVKHLWTTGDRKEALSRWACGCWLLGCFVACWWVGCLAAGVFDAPLGHWRPQGGTV
jgi:hypothetical protein